MRRFTIATIVVALGAVAFAAWSLAAPSGSSHRSAATLKKPNLPTLPSAVKSRGRWQIGVKCDYPPFGFIDKNSKNAGYDVLVAKWFSKLAFSNTNRVDYTCVTTPSRIPTLQAGRVDIIISTITWTKARAQQIDFSIPYYSATGRLLVPNNTGIRRLADLSGKTVTTTSGSVYDRWVRNCFKNTKLLVTTSPSSSVLAVADGRADAFMFDDAFLLDVAANNKNLRLMAVKFLKLPWGIGIRKGETDMKRWVDAAIRYMRSQDIFWKQIFRKIAPRTYFSSFKNNVPRPKSRIAYPTGPDADTICP